MDHNISEHNLCHTLNSFLFKYPEQQYYNALNSLHLLRAQITFQPE